MERLRRTLNDAPQAVLWIPFAVLAWHYWFLCDDAYITFRFAKNWADGVGLVFNPGEEVPVEGYSNFLWLVMCAAFEAWNIDVRVVMPTLSALSGIALLLFFHRALREQYGISPPVAFAATVILGLTPSMGVWATSGLATMPYALLVFLFFERMVLSREPRLWLSATVIGIALALIRTEGLGWVVVISILGLAAHRVDRTRGEFDPFARTVVGVFASVLLVWVSYAAWRYVYYGTLIPNTALVKVGMNLQRLVRGGKYVMLMWVTFPTLVLWYAGARQVLKPHLGAGIATVLMAIAFPVYAVVVGADFMPMGRLMVPGFSFAAILLASLGEHIYSTRPQSRAALGVGAVGMAAAGLLPGFGINYTPDFMRGVLHFRLSDKEFLGEYERWQNMVGNTDGFALRGKTLAMLGRPGDAVVSGAVGAIGYYSGLWIYDQYGLVTREVATRPAPVGAFKESPGHDKKVSAEYFAKYNPRFLYARAVQGRLAARRMNESMERWDVDPMVMDRYVPDFVELEVEGETERTFLLMVRTAEPGEDPARIWGDFPARRRALNAELRAQYGVSGDDEEDEEAIN